MAVTVYLPSSGAAPISPAFGGWASSAGADRVQAVLAPSGTVMANKAGTANDGGTNLVLLRQYILGPLPAQTLTGTVKGQIRCQESAGTANGTLAALIRTVSSDGSVVRGTNLALAAGGTEWATTLTNRVLRSGQPVALTSVAIQVGDFLAIEVGYEEAAGAGSFTWTMSFGDNGGSNLPEDQSTTTALNPWLQFSDLVVAANDEGYSYIF